MSRFRLSISTQIACPATLVLGERDLMTSPKATREIAAALRARSVMLAAGHSLMTEAPDALLGALRSALA